MRKVKIRKIKKKKVSVKPKLLAIKPKPKLKPIKKLGYWCDYYPGRLPFPIECAYNKQTPVEYVFINKKRKCVKNRPNCLKCDRFIAWEDWKVGKWDATIDEIKKGADLRQHPIPFKKE